MRAIPTPASPDPAVYPLTLYFDGACPVCSGEMHNLMLRNTAGLLRFVDISEPGFSAFPPGTGMPALMALMHGVRADGRLAIGAEAIRLAYRGAHLGWVARLMDLPGLRTLCDRAYPAVARHRYRIPRPIVRLVFETGLRRAAERRAGRSACRDDACECHPHPHPPHPHPHHVRRDGSGEAS
ncbi:thiol-disulfide oxidoreductase DCC family protein [Roseateles chitinivorans]|uniref:thiol-disulfide oxidoreductase DCC family protein n=1 Tax=Roseateles chitinivorans TaxID=2917965 RepID=UPI003D66CAD3